jgi:flavorubredoxin
VAGLARLNLLEIYCKRWKKINQELLMVTIALFEAGGGEDEPIYPLRNKFQENGLTEAFPPILVKDSPNQIINQGS